MEDFVAQAQTAGLVIPPTFAATAGFLLALDSDPFGEDGPSKPALLSYFTTLASLSASPLVHFTTDPAAFLNGSAALLVASSSDYPQLAQALGDDLGIAAWPGQGWRTPLQVGPVIVVSLNITRESANAADQFLAYLLAPDSQALWHARTGQAPANPYALPDRDLLSAWGNTLQRSVPLPIAPQDTAQKLAALDIAIKEVVTERLTPGSAADYVLGAFSTP
jgi:ABC-type glycerol-3-phosphate transport system substrate-binding protein